MASSSGDASDVDIYIEFYSVVFLNLYIQT
jgi:hypothetical protein